MKKILYSLIIILVISGAYGILAPSTVNVTHAATFLDVLVDAAGNVIDATVWGLLYPVRLILAILALIFFKISTVIIYIAGFAMNLSIKISVLEMATRITDLKGIQVAWNGLRDLANIFFIFILIYIAVSTILSLSSRASRQTLVKIIVVALLINFSLYFTKVIIDVSNVVTIQFYQAIMANVPAGTTTCTDIADSACAGISGLIMNKLKLSSLYAIGGNASSGLGTQALELLTNTTQFTFTMMMGGIFVLIASFVFFAAAILFIIRLIVLILLMITAPLAYVGMVLPRATSYASKWWKMLFDQCIWAPVFMMLIWAVIKIIGDGSFLTSIAGPTPGGSFKDVFSFHWQSAEASMYIVINYMVIIGLTIASLIAAKQAGVAGSGFATNVAGRASFGLAAWVGKNTGGWASSKFAERMEKADKDSKGVIDRNLYRFKTTRAGAATYKAATKVADSKFDARNIGLGDISKGMGVDLGKPSKISYQKSFDTAVKSKEKIAEKLYKTEEEKLAYAKSLTEGSRAIDLGATLTFRRAQKAAGQNIGQFKERDFNKKIIEQISNIKDGDNYKNLEPEIKDLQSTIDSLRKQLSPMTLPVEKVLLEKELKESEERLSGKQFTLKNFNEETEKLQKQMKKVGPKPKTTKQELEEFFDTKRVKTEKEEKEEE